jgi:hypothetical protein
MTILVVVDQRKRTGGLLGVKQHLELAFAGGGTWPLGVPNWGPMPMR